MTLSLTHWLSDFLILTLQSDPRDLWPLRHLIRVMGRHDLTKKYPPAYPLTYLTTYVPPLENTLNELSLGIWDIWDTDYNTDNWEPGLMTIFVTWQLIVTLDSIRNSCDVLFWDSKFSCNCYRVKSWEVPCLPKILPGFTWFLFYLFFFSWFLFYLVSVLPGFYQWQ